MTGWRYMDVSISRKRPQKLRKTMCFGKKGHIPKGTVQKRLWECNRNCSLFKVHNAHLKLASPIPG